MTRLNGNKFGQALEYTRHHISKLEKQGVIGRGDDGLFDLEETKLRIRERSDEKVGKSEVEPLDLAVCRERKLVADAVEAKWKQIK